jgi:hypothetical protein
VRFYDPATQPCERHDSLELWPNLPEKDGAKKCLKLGFYPSVTTVLGIIREEYLERWLIKEAIKLVLEGKSMEDAVAEVYERESPNAVFGTDCHAVAEWWFGAPKPEVTELVEKHATPILRWFDVNVKERIFSERFLASPSMKVAGAIDLGFIDKQDRRIVGDIKVVKFSDKFPPSPGLAYRCQLSAYREMLREDDGHDYHRMSLYLASPFGWDKKPRLRIFEHDHCYLNAFKACRLLWEEQVTQPDLLTIDPKEPKAILGTFDPTKLRTKPTT